MNGFDACVQWVLAREGEFSNDPGDPGGLTRWGISQKNHPELDVAALTEDQAVAIYLRDYWMPARCGVLPWPLSLAVFDAAVNQGVGTAPRMLQELLGVEQDGEIGPETLRAIASHEIIRLTARYLMHRLRHYTVAPAWLHEGKGWAHRLEQLAETLFAQDPEGPAPQEEHA